MRHFIDVLDHSAADLARILDQSLALKRRMAQGVPDRPFLGRTAALYFEKPSLRTRVSLQIAMNTLGGASLVLEPSTPGELWKREAVKDQARVVSRMVDLVAIRTFAHDVVREFAEHSLVPVVNTLTDHSHPTQALADFMTMRECLGGLEGLTLAYLGDGNNVARSLLELAGRTGVRFVHAGPPGHRLPDEDYARVREACPTLAARYTEDPADAVREADAIYTDVWTSMGQEAEAASRQGAFTAYRVDEALLAKAPAKAIVLHCLPAHRGDEITDAVMDGPRAAVYQQAENRMHAYRGLFTWLLDA